MQVSVHCPYCRKATAITPAPFYWQPTDRRQIPELVSDGDPKVRLFARIPERPTEEWWIGQCNACHGALLVANEGHRVFPTPQPEPVAEEVPEPMRANLSEARLCLSVGALNSAATMARRAVQGACREKGATGRNLEDEINALATKGFITANLRDAAHEVRYFGNDGAHPSEEEIKTREEPVSIEEAEEAVVFAWTILEQVYVLPAKVKAAKDRRTGAKS